MPQVRSFPKEGRIRLETDEYKKFSNRIFERDGWKCRNPKCRSVMTGIGLTLHHLRKRSHNGSDVPGNAITVCAICHDAAEKNTLRIEVVDVVVKFKEA